MNFTEEQEKQLAGRPAPAPVRHWWATGLFNAVPIDFDDRDDDLSALLLGRLMQDSARGRMASAPHPGVMFNLSVNFERARK